MKFRRKVTEIEAEQFLGPPPSPLPDGVMADGDCCYVKTAHGQLVYLEPGDWIVPELNGRGHYPIKDDIMKQTYEAIPCP
jgi:hypothetical protein